MSDEYRKENDVMVLCHHCSVLQAGSRGVVERSVREGERHLHAGHGHGASVPHQ